jgi:hypothetical protein
MSHSWEVEDHAWDAGAWNEDSDDERMSEQDKAGSEFLEVLLGLYMASALTAQHFCVLCYWAAKGGVPGVVATYALPPGRQSGKYQAHLDDKLLFKSKREKMYLLQTPGMQRADISRSRVTLYARPGHETLDDECSDASYSVRCREAIEGGTLPSAYTEHTVTTSNPHELVSPLAIYMDAVPYSQVDSVLGVWLVNMITGSRHIMCLVRKKIVCTCGCKGYCTFAPVLLWLKWVIDAMANGVFPLKRHDGSDFDASSDQYRIGLAGTRMRFKAAVVHLKGDWAEICERFGFPTWQSGMRPCFCCSAIGDSMYEGLGVDFIATPWHINVDEDYSRACSRCERWVTMESAAHHGEVLDALAYDKRDAGARGRAMRRPVGCLLAGDRLEPNARMLDVAEFDTITEFPCDVLFWRRSEETLCTHRCPIFDASVGVTPSKSIAIDLLHTLFLGGILIWGGIALWRLLRSGVWGAFETTDEEQLKVAILSLRAELLAWYAAQQRLGIYHTQLASITKKMIGTSAGEHLKLKAMEAYGFLQFLLYALDRYKNRCHVPNLLEAGFCLQRLVEHLKASPCNMTPGQVQVFVCCYCAERRGGAVFGARTVVRRGCVRPCVREGAGVCPFVGCLVVVGFGRSRENKKKGHAGYVEAAHCFNEGA